MKKIILNRARCKKCGQVLESKSPHAYQMCPCGNFVSGGTRSKVWGGPNRNDLEDKCEYEEAKKEERV